VLVEIVLHRGGEATHADRSDNARDTAYVTQLKTSDILSLRGKVIRSARAAPIVAAIVRKIETSLRTSDNVVAVVRIDPHLPNCIVLRKLAGWLGQRCAKHACAQHCPVGARVGRLQNALTTH